MANQETRNCVVGAIKKFCNSKKSEYDRAIFSIADNGEDYHILINSRSILVEFKYIYIDFDGFRESPVYFSVEFTMIGGYKYTANSFIDNHIREFLKDLQTRIKEDLDNKRLSDSLKRKVAKMDQKSKRKTALAQVQVIADAWEYLVQD